MNRPAVSAAILATLTAATAPADAALVNLALNPTQMGLPSPLESDSGWGGGALPWEIVDGLHSYSFWAHGLAFTGGHTTAAGGPPWIQPAGVRQATINLGSAETFEKVIIWHHGVEHTPMTAYLDYWNGTSWVSIPYVREYGTMEEAGSNSGNGTSDIYAFTPVTGSKVRYSFDNSGQNILGTFNIHGWLYEFEVWAERASVPEAPSTLLLGLGLLAIAGARRRRAGQG